MKIFTRREGECVVQCGACHYVLGNTITEPPHDTSCPRCGRALGDRLVQQRFEIKRALISIGPVWT